MHNLTKNPDEKQAFFTGHALLPFATLAQSDSHQAILAQVAERVVKISDIEQRQNIAGCAEILAELRFEKDLIRQFLGEDVMRESIIYQDIVQKEAFRLISRLINRRFGELGSSFIEQIGRLSVEQLEELGEELLDFSEIADLQAWLEQESKDGFCP